jgi:hypothetical protein
MPPSYDLSVESFDDGTKKRGPGRRASILVTLVFVLLSPGERAVEPEDKVSVRG